MATQQINPPVWKREHILTMDKTDLRTMEASWKMFGSRPETLCLLNSPKMTLTLQQGVETRSSHLCTQRAATTQWCIQ